jgi:pimeloyl-ACP methyl ester carboxylesterase
LGAGSVGGVRPRLSVRVTVDCQEDCSFVKARKHGAGPYQIAVVHGGPGAPGSVVSVARELSGERGVLEPFQSATSVGGQTAELASILEQFAVPPVTLIGHSWGAWLSVLVAAERPDLVGKLVLVGSGPFEAHFAERIMPARIARLDHEEQLEAQHLLSRLEGSDAIGANAVLGRFGELMNKASAYDPLLHAQAKGSAPPPHDDPASQNAIYQSVWPEARELRRSGRLLEIAAGVRSPVLAIHGDHDPHPADGVHLPLARVLAEFRFLLLLRCGHEPWQERHARDGFFAVLREELNTG